MLIPNDYCKYNICIYVYISYALFLSIFGRFFWDALCAVGVLLRFHALRRTGEVLRKLERPPRAVSWQLGVGLDVGLEAGACPRHAQTPR